MEFTSDPDQHDLNWLDPIIMYSFFNNQIRNRLPIKDQIHDTLDNQPVVRSEELAEEIVHNELGYVAAT